MRTVSAAFSVLGLVLMVSATAMGQTPGSSQSASLPRVISITGVVQPVDGQPLREVETVTLAIYADPIGGTPLWQETQNVVLDARGRYALLLGATSAEGIPAAVVASGAQWLGTTVHRQREVEGARVQLTSVPYALRAADADTLGGRPASAYLLAPDAGDAAKATNTGATTKKSNASGASAGASTTNAVLPGTDSFLAKYVNGGADIGSSGVFEDAGGSVGIGTTTPLDHLHVRYDNNTGDFTGYAVQNTNPGALAYSGMLFYDHTGALTQFQGYNNSTHEYRINNIARVSPGGAFNGSINFMQGGVSKFLVAPNGNIGIGTLSPQGSLELSRSGSNAVLLETVYTNGNANANAFSIARLANGSPAAPSAVQAGNIIGAWVGAGYGATQFGNPTAGMAAIAQENWTDTAQGSSTGFFSTAIGSNQAQLHMAVLASGNVGIGDLSSPGSTPAADRLQVFGDIRVGDSDTNGCLKNFAGTGLVGTCASDRRFKKDITPFDPVLDQLTALQPVHYFWRTAEFPERHFGDARNYGLIAQDVEKVLPELVVTNDDGYKAIDYSKLPLLTIQAVKDLKSENDTLKERVAELERIVSELLATSRR